MCEKSFPVQEDLTKHIKIVHTDSITQCPYCEHKTKDPRNMRRHIKTHTREGLHKCLLCDYTCIEKRDMKTHSVKHTGIKIPCDKCEKQYPNQRSLDTHMKTVHSQERFYCENCPRTFVAKLYLKLHIKKVHTNPKSYPCSKCSESFVHWTIRDTHLLEHDGIEVFKCTLCPFMYKYRGNLEIHIKEKHQNIRTRKTSKKAAVPKDKVNRIEMGRRLVVKVQRLEEMAEFQNTFVSRKKQKHFTLK